MISAKIIAHSFSSVTGQEIITFELEYPRIIHAEFLTHRMISRNSASSRAIPFDKMVNQLTGRPIRFGEANKGMQDKGEHFESGPIPAKALWDESKKLALEQAKKFHDLGYHKQVYNRLTEPFQLIKTVATATEWGNFFWLRKDPAADPTLQALAKLMSGLIDNSLPQELKPGEWHLPYVGFERYFDPGECYYITEQANSTVTWKHWLSLEEAKKVSAARCAAVSFRNIDYGLGKCEEVFEKLIGAERKHASALEHQATPIPFIQCQLPQDADYPGISHVDLKERPWSGNFQGWIQYRKLIPGENMHG